MTGTSATPPPAGRTARGGRGATAVLAIAGLVTAVFFFSFRGRNAEALGRYDMGVALALSFAVPIAFYASLICAALALLGAGIARTCWRPAGRWLAALLVSLLPALFLLLVDLL